LTMPPLRERIDDIPQLARLFLEQYALKYQMPVLEMEQSAMHILLQYSWPGNVRELKNMMERLVILTEKPRITKNELIQYFPNLYNNRHVPNDPVPTLTNEKENIEKNLIEDTLKLANGIKS